MFKLIADPLVYDIAQVWLLHAGLRVIGAWAERRAGCSSALSRAVMRLNECTVL